MHGRFFHYRQAIHKEKEAQPRKIFFPSHKKLTFCEYCSCKLKPIKDFKIKTAILFLPIKNDSWIKKASENGPIAVPYKSFRLKQFGLEMRNAAKKLFPIPPRGTPSVLLLVLSHQKWTSIWFCFPKTNNTHSKARSPGHGTKWESPGHGALKHMGGGTRSADFSGRIVKVYFTPH